MPSQQVSGGNVKHLIDREKQRAYSTFSRQTRMDLSQIVRLIRGETQEDSRPNKALEIPRSSSWSTYRYRELWEDIVRHGVRPGWNKSFPKQRKPPANHASATESLNALVEQIRKGQDAGHYLVLDLDLLPTLQGVSCSPFGAVQNDPASGTSKVRAIHDLSYPEGASVNDNTAENNSITVAYDGPHAMAHRILEVEKEYPGKVMMMSGDVSGAFKHIPVHADYVGRFAGTIEELGILIIDLSCPFGWKLSSQHYWTTGSAISHTYASTAPQWPLQPSSATQPFDAKTWCDDHNLIEPDVGTRLEEANLAIRKAIVEVLGPEAINEDKFTPWFKEGKSLGLLWDIPHASLAMPPDKIEKAMQRVSAMIDSTSATKTQLHQLLGSLRHVVTCVRTGSSFYQRLSALTYSSRRSRKIPITAAARDDLLWFKMILSTANLNAVPLVRFISAQNVDFEIYMDASVAGLCALFPQRREYLQFRYDAEELCAIKKFRETGSGDYGINLRELMSAVFASLVWGHHWSSLSSHQLKHVRFWIDNTSAISWNNRRNSRNREAQMLLSIMTISETLHSYYATAAHIAGVDNTMADAGSRVWQSPQHNDLFTNLSYGWTQVQIPATSRKLSQVWVLFCAQGRWPHHPESTTADTGISGQNGADG